MRYKDRTKTLLNKLVKGTNDKTYDTITRLFILKALEVHCGKIMNTTRDEYGHQWIDFDLAQDIARHIRETVDI